MLEEAIERLEDLDVRVKIDPSVQRERLKADVVRREGPSSSGKGLAHKSCVEGRYFFHVPPDDLIVRHVAPPTFNATFIEFWEYVIAQPDVMDTAWNTFG